MTAQTIYLAEITAWDPVAEEEIILRYSTGRGFTTGPDRENILLQSRVFDNVSWLKGQTGAASVPVVTANQAASPDGLGTITADKVEFTCPAGGGNQSFLAQAGTVTAGAKYAGSLYVKAFAAVDVGKILLFRHVGASDYVQVIVTERWQRVGVVEIAAVAPAVVFSLALRPDNGSSSGTVTVLLTSSQLELGSGVSGYIDTTTVAVSRPNPNMYYDRRVLQPLDVQRDLFREGTTFGRSRVGFGELVLSNLDGALDAYVDHGFDGRLLRLLRGPADGDYAFDFVEVFSGTMEQPEFTTNRVVLRVRDNQFEMDRPLQSTLYAGDNVAPDGLEGSVDLAGTPKPVCLGRVRNVSPILVNAAKLIYQVHDDELESVDAVYDRGIELGAALQDWTTISQLDALTNARALCFGDGLWVVGGGVGGVDGGRIETSPDGIDWTVRTPDGLHGFITGIAYSPTLDIFVAVSSSNGGIEGAASSPDGITWTARDSGTSQTLNNVAWCPSLGMFIAVGNAGVLVTSTNGTSWTTRTSSFSSTVIWGVCEGIGGLVVAVGESGKLATSPDGINWTQRASQFGTDHIYSVTSNGFRFVAVGLAGKIATSDTGVAWTLRDAGVLIPGSFLIHAEYGGGWFLALDTAGAALIASRDGVTWQVLNAGTFSAAYEVRYNSVDNVFGLIDQGASPNRLRTTLIQSDYGSAADLEDDTLAPSPGTFKSYLAGGYIRLGSPPDGRITVDATQGATAADRTAGQMFVEVLGRMGFTAGDWVAADITTLDSANAAALGIFIVSLAPASQILDLIAGSVGAWWGTTRAGLFRIEQVVAPTGTAVASFSDADLLRPLERLISPDMGRGVPTYRVLVHYARNYTVQVDDLAFGVSDAQRALVGKEWFTVEAIDPDVLLAHLLSPVLEVHTLFQDAADAQDEADRLLALRSVRRDLVQLVVPQNAVSVVLDPGGVVELTHPRYGLSAGKKFLLTGVQPDGKIERITLTMWG